MYGEQVVKRAGEQTSAGEWYTWEHVLERNGAGESRQALSRREGRCSKPVRYVIWSDGRENTPATYGGS